MDGEIRLWSNKYSTILIYWNQEILLEEEEVFDTQKGIVRKITVQKLGEDDIIKINNKRLIDS